MDDEPMWAVDRFVAPTPGSAITIPETVNEFAIKALFDRLLREIRAFAQHENESLTDAWLRMKEMPQNCHGHNLSKGNIIKIFYHGLSEITQEVLNVAAGGIFLYKTPNQTYQLLEDKVLLKLDWIKNKKPNHFLRKSLLSPMKYKELQSRAKKPMLDLDEDDMPMPREEEAKCMQTFSENMFVEVGKFTFPADFLILKMEEDSKVPLILGRPFLHTADAHSYSNDDTCFSIDVIDEILEEDFDALLDEGSEILYSIKGTLLEEEIFTEFDKFMAMTADENYDSESDIKEQPFEKITINTDYKIKTSLEEPPTDLELKPLPDNLEYVFLEEPSFLPIIISSQLSEKNKSKLIQLLDDKKPVVQKQRRLNPNMQEVVKKEIMKLLDTGIIYPIADSPWVSPIHCVPKKGGITVVTNKNDELVST
ncbi:hypothetical protein Tco_1036285 [Tanacetum coccineum]